MVIHLHARQDSNLRRPTLEIGVLAARPRTYTDRRAVPTRKVEALIPTAEAANGVRIRARPGAFTFQCRPPHGRVVLF